MDNKSPIQNGRYSKAFCYHDGPAQIQQPPYCCSRVHHYAYGDLLWSAGTSRSNLHTDDHHNWWLVVERWNIYFLLHLMARLILCWLLIIISASSIYTEWINSSCRFGIGISRRDQLHLMLLRLQHFGRKGMLIGMLHDVWCSNFQPFQSSTSREVRNWKCRYRWSCSFFLLFVEQTAVSLGRNWNKSARGLFIVSLPPKLPKTSQLHWSKVRATRFWKCNMVLRNFRKNE